MLKKRKQIGLSSDGETIILHKFHGEFESPKYFDQSWVSHNQQLLGRGAALDVETTGLSFPESKIIEVAIRPFFYRRDTWEVLSVESGYSGLEDPCEPLPEQIKSITGLTDHELSGKHIDWKYVNQIIESVDFVVAHNAKFDRPFVDRSASSSVDKLWACSFSQIDWGSRGFDVQKLEILSYFHGFFVDAHRAMSDVNAILYLLSTSAGDTDNPYLKELIFSSSRLQVLIYAQGSPFESKDLLRLQGYRWNAQLRTWFRIAYQDNLESEIKWLEEKIYLGKFRGQTKPIPLNRTFVFDE